MNQIRQNPETIPLSSLPELANWAATPDLDDGPMPDWEEVYGLLYHDLRRIARSQIQQIRMPVFSPSSLVNLTWLRLAGSDLSPSSRRHFLALAARAMRFIVVDEVRSLQAHKRGEGISAVSLDADEHELQSGPYDAIEIDRIEALNEALENLSRIDERLAHVVELRYFGGFSEAQIAEQLGITVRTVRRDWRKARAWLRGQLEV